MTSERALKMHDLALSVVRSKGVTKLEGSTSLLAYRYGLLTIEYRSEHGQLDVWFLQRVLSVERFEGHAADHSLPAWRLGASSDRGDEGGRVSDEKRALHLYSWRYR